MFELCRKIVAGPKKKLQWNGKELDFTYITDRIIAMAFPASGLQSAYRNSIKDVSEFLHERHGNHFMIVNVSSRKYDYKFFNNNVLQYQWRDHLSPPLSTLWEIGRQMYEYLKKNKNNVVAVHCNHGKGRTGTTIISFLMFIGFFEKFDEALNFYNKRRFVSLTYGVSQPCQKRYLNYFQILKHKQHLAIKLICYKVKSIQQKGLPSGKYFLQILSIRKDEPKYKQIFFNEKSEKLCPNVPLMGDICIQIFQDKWSGSEEIAMINCHTFFFDGTENFIKMDQSFIKNSAKDDEISKEKRTSSFSISACKQERFLGKNIKINGNLTSDFQIIIDFEWFCFCHLEKKDIGNCPCQNERLVEEKNWKKTIENVQLSKNISKLEACSLISTIEYLHEQSHEQNFEKQKKLEEKKSLNESNQNTESSPLTSEEEKQGIGSDKESCEIEFTNSLPTNSHKTDSKYFQNDEFEYDLVILNRNSTSSI